jgi:hypothetical protein
VALLAVRLELEYPTKRDERLIVVALLPEDRAAREVRGGVVGAQADRFAHGRERRIEMSRTTLGDRHPVLGLGILRRRGLRDAEREDDARDAELTHRRRFYTSGEPARASCVPAMRSKSSIPSTKGTAIENHHVTLASAAIQPSCEAIRAASATPVTKSVAICSAHTRATQRCGGACSASAPR